MSDHEIIASYGSGGSFRSGRKTGIKISDFDTSPSPGGKVPAEEHCTCTMASLGSSWAWTGVLKGTDMFPEPVAPEDCSHCKLARLWAHQGGY